MRGRSLGRGVELTQSQAERGAWHGSGLQERRARCALVLTSVIDFAATVARVRCRSDHHVVDRACVIVWLILEAVQRLLMVVPRERLT